MRRPIDKSENGIPTLWAILKRFFFVLVLASAATSCTAPSTAAKPNRPYAPIQENPFWTENRERLNRDKDTIELNTIPRGIFVRAETTGHTLVKFGNSEQVFRYVPGSGNITPATADDWASAGKEVDCRSAEYMPRKTLELNETEAVVSTQGTGRLVPTHGRFALDAYESSDGTRALILSADGPKEPVRPAIWGFGGSGGGTLGIRYLQVFSIDRQSYSGDAVALKSSEKAPMFNYCWGPDERIALAYESKALNTISFEINFHIIETPR